MGTNEITFFTAFLLFVFTLLFIDLGVFSKKSHIVKFREAFVWTLLWVSLGIGFYFFLRTNGEMIHGVETPAKLLSLKNQYSLPIELTGDWLTDIEAYRRNMSLEFITGYLIEYALSVDNIFVMIVIFGAFGVKERYYKRILFWGVLGAVVMRFCFIFLGASLLESFHWVMYVFGGILLFTGIKMLFEDKEEEQMDPAKHPAVKFIGRFMRVYPRYVGSRFFIRKKGLLYITPLFVALLVVEFTDVVFAFDSVPAIFSITKDPYIVFFSNIFAIMGLRSLFFLLSNIMHWFHYLKFGLGILMLFIGVKMMFHEQLHSWGLSTQGSLYVILTILALSIIASVLFPQSKEEKAAKEN